MNDFEFDRILHNIEVKQASVLELHVKEQEN